MHRGESMAAPKTNPFGEAATTLPPESKWRRSSKVTEYLIDKEGLLFHSGLQLLSHLNETAMYIWRHCEGRTTDSLVAALADHFGVEQETARRHVTRTLELFSVSGFVEARAESAGE